jgi:hypothetical protein
MKARTALKIFATGLLLILLLGVMKWFYLPVPVFALILCNLVLIGSSMVLAYKFVRSLNKQHFLES